MLRRAALLLCLILGGVALAQESAHFKLKGPVLNSGGDPLNGADVGSGSFLLRPDALGESATAQSLHNGSFLSGGGFIISFPQPAEINNLIFTNSFTLAWDADPFAAHYHLYRTPEMGPLAGVAPSADCLDSLLADPTRTDAAEPAVGRAFFYVATAVNCIRLEGPDSIIGLRCN